MTKKALNRNAPLERFVDRLVPLLFGLLAAAAIVPALPMQSSFGPHIDWDSCLMFYEVQRRTILEFGQLPLWNPYNQGGTILLAHPESTVLYPGFAVVLILGTIRGVLLLIGFHLFLGLWGMYRLGRYFELSPLGAFLGAACYMFSEIYGVRMDYGHLMWMGMGLVPWIFLTYLKGLRERRCGFVCAGLIALLIFLGAHGIIYNVVALIVAYSLSLGLVRLVGKLRPGGRDSFTPPGQARTHVRLLVLIGAFTFLFGSAKIIPSLVAMGDSPRFTRESDMFSWRPVTVDLEQTRFDQWGFPGNLVLKSGSTGSPEYHTYLGIGPILLLIIGCAAARGTSRRALIPLLLILLVFSLGVAPGLGLMAHMVPVRYFLGAVFAASLLAGIGLDRVAGARFRISGRALPAGAGAALLATIWISADLFGLTQGYFGSITLRARPGLARSEQAFHQVHDPRLAMVDAVRTNRGLINGFSSMPLRNAGRAVAMDSPEYRGEAFLVRTEGDARIRRFSPNRVEVDISTAGPGLLVLNQAYSPGWRATDAPTGKSLPVTAFNGLISTTVEGETSRIVFSYLPTSVLIGAAISALSLIWVCLFLM